MKNFFLFNILLIFSIVSIFGYLYLVLKNERDINESLYKKEIDIQKYLLLESYVNLKNSYVTLNNFDNLDKIHPIFTLDKQKIIFYYRSDMCNICLEKELSNLSLISNIVGEENIILISRGFSTKYFNNDIKISHWSNKKLLKNELFLNDDNIESPIILVLDHNNNVTAKYFSSKNNPEYFKIFFDYYIAKVFNNQK